MAESLRRRPRRWPNKASMRIARTLPIDASTLHRLLGTLPDSPRFRHHADNPLPFDIVVVDEASMVDLPLMCKLTEAVADRAQLVLLGDPDQLPSVEAGDVLAAILAAAGAGDALSAGDAAALQPLLGTAAIDADTSSLRGHRVHLQRGWRQDEALHLAPLAEAVRNGDASQALALLRGGTLQNVHFHEGADDPLHARPGLLAQWRTLATHTIPPSAAQANRLRLLTACASRRARAASTPASGRTLRPPHRPPARVVPRPPAAGHQNSYRHKLFNGDVGICLPDATAPTGLVPRRRQHRDARLPSRRAARARVRVRDDRAQGAGQRVRRSVVATAARRQPRAQP
jgi:exodeoxyribonuclease V alpha subunit